MDVVRGYEPNFDKIDDTRKGERREKLKSTDVTDVSRQDSFDTESKAIGRINICTATLGFYGDVMLQYRLMLNAQKID